jgi:hypothetical protein
MALIKCPDCGKDISDLASICIGCGRPIQNPPNRRETPPDPTTMGHNFEKDVSKQTPGDKDQNQFFPIIEKPPSDIPTEKQSLSSPPSPLPNRWLKFYTYVFLPIYGTNFFFVVLTLTMKRGLKLPIKLARLLH